MLTSPDILKLPPNRVWRTYLGGKILDSIEGKPQPADSHFPEDWIASTTLALNSDGPHPGDEGLSKVEIDGDNLTLKSLIEKYPFEMVGLRHFEKYGANTQFLLKLLDSSVRLHIQAHPTIEFAKERLGSSSGKTEAYVILSTREEVKDPYIYLGFQYPRSREEFRKAVMNQDAGAILSCFDKIPVKPGDAFIIPGGLPHAIGEGVFMIEVMEPTDFVVRLEFESGGYVLPEEARFMGRGIDFAMDMIDFNPHPVQDIRQNNFCVPTPVSHEAGGNESVLIDASRTPCFSVHRLEVNSRFRKKSDSFYVGFVTGGGGTIRVEETTVEVRAGDKFFVPFHTSEAEFLSSQGMEAVLAFPPV